MRHEFHPEALDEYEEAARYYAERSPQLAERFISSVENAIDLILESPERWRTIDEDVRRCLTRVFPYGILYTIESDYVLIVAVMHCSRRPGYWKSRLE
jgi:plasmid stabilization system protein ParE